MKASRRDFKLIAGILNSVGKQLPFAEYVRVVTAFSGALADSNPEFDADVFIAACHGKKLTKRDKAKAADKRAADRVDGYDRDDLGPSED